MKLSLSSFLGVVLLLGTAAAQLSGRVGPTTTREQKAAKKICNILQYGGQASKAFDNGPAFAQAWSACKTGGQIYIPPGDYGLATWLDVSGGRGMSVNLEGVFHRISSATAGGNMFAFSNTDDFEFYSANSKGAIQGYGWERHREDQYGYGQYW
jgi:rhamnogalacturonan hydrolase